ncbi:hypothetical protein Tco_0401899 [Tanacetum coccineum]
MILCYHDEGSRFLMSNMEAPLLLGLNVKTKEDGIFINSDMLGANLDKRNPQQEVVKFFGRRSHRSMQADADNCGYFYYRDRVLKIHTDYNIADLLTKAFDVSRLRATYGAELVSAASLVNTARPTLSAARLGKVGAARHKSWCCQAKVCAACYRYYCCSQTVNDEKQIHATIDSKAVVVTEASIRSSLLLNDADAHTQKVFSNMSRKGVKFSRTVTPLFDCMLVPHQAPEGEAEGGMTLDELSVLCTNLSNRVLALEASKDAQAAEIIKLKTRIKKLKKKSHPVISHHRAWLRSVSRLSMKRKLGRKESVSKQGRKNAKPRPTLDAFDDLDVDLAHGMEYMDTEEAVNEKGGSTVSTVRPERVSTAGVTINTVDPEISVVEPRTPPTTASIFDDEDVTMAQTLIKMKEEKAKEKGVAFKDVEDSSRPARSILTLKPLPIIDPKDKGKGVLQEPEPAKKMAKSDFDAAQIARDAKIATPSSKMGGYKHSQLKAKSFEEIKGMYERQKKSVQDFVPIGSAEEEKLIKKMNEKATGEETSNKEKVLEEPDSTKVEVKQEGNTYEKEQLKAFLMIVPDEKGEINYEVLNRRYSIVNWESKFYHTDRYRKPHDYYRVFRADGSSRYIKTFTEMVSRFDRLDFIELHSLILKSWNFYDDRGVNILVLEDGTEFYMLAERRYPLTKETLERMLALRLIAESKSEAVFDLLRFIQQQIDESGSHDGSEKDL